MSRNCEFNLYLQALLLGSLLALNVSCVGCSGSAERSDKGRERKGEVQGIVAKPGLVQVLIYGLAVFDLNKYPPVNELSDARVLFAKAHKHELKIWSGKEKYGQNIFYLDRVNYEFFSDVSGMDNVTITFPEAMGLGMTAVAGDFPIDEFPDEEGESPRDVRWMLRAINMDAFRSLKGGNLQAILKMDKGKIETCGLVHPPDDFQKACAVSTDEMSKARAAAEYMIYRFEVDSRVDKLAMLITRANGSDTIYFEPTWEETGSAGGMPYSRIFDLVIANLGPKAPRGVKSDHAKHLKSLFVEPLGAWEMRVPDCKYKGEKWECGRASCKAGIQPPCLDYFARRYGDWEAAAGNNRPICPMVEYP